MGDAQDEAPLYEALSRAAGVQAFWLHVPAHRQKAPRGGDVLQGAYHLDLTELPGLDDLHCPRGAIERAQALAARAYGADRTFFLVNGSTGGLLALILAALTPGQQLVLPRNIHRSVMAAVIFSGADPVWVDPVYLADFNLTGGMRPQALHQALTQARPGAVLTVHPTYFGLAGDLKGLVKVAHEAGWPVIVDEAHGAHLRFHPALLADAMACGADASVQSTHKTGGALTQASMLHLKEGLLDTGRLMSALNLGQTTSPSFPLLASLDLARRNLVREGRARLEEILSMAAVLRQRLAGCAGLAVLGPGDVPGGFLDPTRVVVSTRGTGLTGYEVAHILWERYSVRVELATPDLILAILGIGTAREDGLGLATALEDICVREGRKTSGLSPVVWPPRPAKRLAPREAWFAGRRRVALAGAAGLVSAELIAVHPPGLVVICPGEEITPEVVEYLIQVRRLGLSVHGAADPALGTVRVVD
ncbi:MAG TPA: aminotransferase class I/II-fold pyridoxal phosphate-dependent enzyme [Spirochaetia bacterium]|nr:aminotransferase class I/II-fold pyridoxal phosphate-dependent enzyme [Spirochaetia bacterium]